MNNKKGLLFVLSGPSGIGKSTIRKRLIEENNNFWYSISMTTRTPRIDEKTNQLEVNGKEYYFVNLDEFKENIKNNNFLEYALVYKDIYYGTPKNKVLEMLDKGYNVLLEIDVDGAKIIKSNYKDAILIFVKPKSLEDLEYRLKNRNSDSEEKIKERLEKAKYEIANSAYYDYIIVSDTKEKDYHNIKDIIQKELNISKKND